MTRREYSNEVVFFRPNGAFGTIGAMVLGGGILELDGRLRLAEERFEIEGGLIVQLNMGERVIERREKFAENVRKKENNLFSKKYKIHHIILL